MTKVYLAGKITANGWRHTIFKGLRNHRYDNDFNFYYSKKVSPMIVDGFEYAGPYFLSDNHCSFHGEGTPGRGVGYTEKELILIPHREIESKKTVINKCLQWIEDSDEIFVWIDSTDIFGTIAEIGYAKALKKPIFVAIDAQLRNHPLIEDMWFPIHSAKQFIYTKTAKEAWEVFVGSKERVIFDRATSAQIGYIRNLCERHGKTTIVPLGSLSKDKAGKLIAYFQNGKFEEEVCSMFEEMTDEEKEQAPIYNATGVYEIVMETFKYIPGFTFSVQRHTSYVKKHKARENREFSKIYEDSSYLNSFYTLYTEKWVKYLIDVIKKELMEKEGVTIEELKRVREMEVESYLAFRERLDNEV